MPGAGEKRVDYVTLGKHFPSLGLDSMGIMSAPTPQVNEGEDAHGVFGARQREEVKDGTCCEHHLLLCSVFSKHLLAPGKVPGLKELLS